MRGWKSLKNSINWGLEIFENSIQWKLEEQRAARCPLLNVMDFRFWFTFGADYKFMSSKFWKINKWGGMVEIEADGWEKSQKLIIKGGRLFGTLEYIVTSYKKFLIFE